MDRRSDKELFEAFADAVRKTDWFLHVQDPAVALDAQPDCWTLRGLITPGAVGGVWWPFDANPALLRARGPEALADDFVEGYKEARRNRAKTEAADKADVVNPPNAANKAQKP